MLFLNTANYTSQLSKCFFGHISTTHNTLKYLNFALDYNIGTGLDHYLNVWQEEKCKQIWKRER